MSTTPLLLALLLALPAALGMNHQALRSSDALADLYHGEGRHRPVGAPATDAPAGFLARVRTRERAALLASLVLACGGALAAYAVGAPGMVWLCGIALAGACTGRALAIAYVSGREAFRARTPGPRVSHGRAPRLTDLVRPVPWLVLTGGTVLFLASYVPEALRLRPDQRGWVLAAAALAAVFLATGWAAAIWLARQPQVAGSVTEVGWSDALRRRDATALLILGPVWAFGVTASAYAGDGAGGTGIAPLDQMSWGFTALVVLFGLAMALRNHASTRGAHR